MRLLITGICGFVGSTLARALRDYFPTAQIIGIERPFDIPWMVLDAGQASQVWGWAPQMGIHQVLEEITKFAEVHPDWCRLSLSP